jgi:surface antigen
VARALAVLGCLTAVGMGAPTASALQLLFWEPNASLFWTINHAAIVTLFQNGQCTQLAANKRPDIVQKIIVGFIANDIATGHVEAIPNFDARYWTANAQHVGIPTGKRPRVGALMVFQPGVLGAGSAGHIAYVQRVRRRSFTISEMHAPVLFQVTYATLGMSVARRAGISFIY